MKVLTCAAARRRLQAYHDDELTIGEQIEMGAHLEWCDPCGRTLSDLRMVRSALRSVSPGRASLVHEEAVSLHASVVARTRAERTMSWSVRVRSMFEDMHFVYAGLGAGAATVTCLMIMLSMMRFATSEHSPGSNQNPMVVDANILLPRALDQTLMTAMANRGSDEGMYTLSAIVTREGRVVNLEVHPEKTESGATPSDMIDQVAKNLAGVVSQARFEPARVAGLPVAVSMVWMVAHTTVRASVKGPFEVPSMMMPTAKKRRVDLTLPAPAPRPIVAI
jgi:hypothetical protein